MDQDEARRVRAAQGGDAAAFQELVRRHYGMAFAIAYARLGEAEAAEDAAQETFLRAWLHLGRLEDPARFAAWAARIARNLAADWAASGRRGGGVARRLAQALPLEAVPEPADPSDAGARRKMEREEELDWLRRALAELPAEQRELVLLHYMEGLSKKEIAERLEVHPSTVVRQMRAALAALKGRLEPVLRQAAPRLRPAAAAGRASAIIAMAAMLTAAQQARLAAAAPVAETPLALASAPPMPAAPSILGNLLLSILNAVLGALKPLAALAGAGGKTIGLGKLLAGIGLLGALAGGGAFYWKMRHPVPEGIYIWPAYADFPYLVIGRDSMGKPLNTRAAYSQWRIEPAPEGFELWRRRDDLFKQLGRMDSPLLLPDPQTGERIWHKEQLFVPSATTPGDWDILEVTDDPTGPTQRLRRPLPSGLHRVNDPRVVDFIRKTSAVRCQEWPDLPGNRWPIRPQRPPLAPHDDLKRLGAELVRDHPGDLYVEMLYLDALIAARDFKALEAEIEKHRPQYQRPSMLRVPFRRAERALAGWKLGQSGKNAANLIIELGRSDLAGWLRRLPEIHQYDGFATPSPTVWVEEGVPSFLSPQVMAKVTGIISIYHMMLGRRDAALQELVANYRLNQLMGEESGLIGRLVSIAGRAIIIHYLELFALNACESPQELAALWEWLEHLNGHEPKALNPFDWLQTYSLFRLEPVANFLPEEEWIIAGLERPNFEEAGVRNGVADVRFQLLRTAAAARGRQLVTGVLPRGAGEFAPLLPAGLPQDPFGNGPLRLTPMPGGVICYSVGPDRQDDQGAITYDPSNGTVSRGDVTVEVPLRRKYPFPRGGVRALSPQALLAQFPNGLPPDPFADHKGKPLGVSVGYPVYVYSYGPDGDEWDSSAIHPQVMYDPTNGTSSTGDVFLQIPAR